jgi:hypothetical protein
MNEHAIFEEVGKNKLRPNTSMIRRKWGREIVALIDRMWDNNSDARPAMPEVVRLLKYVSRLHTSPLSCLFVGLLGSRRPPLSFRSPRVP